METLVSSFSLKAQVIYLVPGASLLGEIFYYYCRSNTREGICAIWPYITQESTSAVIMTGIMALIVIASIGLGMFLEVLRVTIIPRLFRFDRRTPSSLFFHNLDLYEKLFDRIFLGGNFCYNMIFPAILNPITIHILGWGWWGFFANIVSALVLGRLGYLSERKFYQLIQHYPGN